MAKIGRNQPCPCGSGKKYKRCHGALTNKPVARTAKARRALKPIPFHALPAEVRRKIEEHKREEQRYRAKHGRGRPMVTLEHLGHRVVAVGSELHFVPADKTKFFPDFLGRYLRGQLGVEWGKAELAKPSAERHQILNWHDSLARYMQSLKPDPDGAYRAKPCGATLSWYRLAYDLYLIKHNAKLQARILERLRHPDQFQGARFELCVAAAMVVAGFEIDYEDESDGTRKHAEFRAKHASGLTVAVEAKSRHRDGLLGFKSPGAKVTDKVAVEGILRDALAKESEAPYFIFVEVNLPPFASPPDESNPWFKELAETAATLQQEYEPGTFPATAIFFCNDPSHYVPDTPIDNQQYWIYCVPGKSHRYPTPDERLLEIGQAAMQRCNIPNEFPKEWTG